MMIARTIIASGVALGLLLAAAGNGRAADADKDAPVKLSLHLFDGSRIVGTPGLTAFPLQTSYAKMTIPVGKVRRIEATAEGEVVDLKKGETVSVRLRNDDRLQAVLLLDAVELTTLFGKATIDLKHVISIDVRAEGESSGPGPLLSEYAADVK